MLETARSSPWILQVADVAAQLKADLARIPVTAMRGAHRQQGQRHRRRAPPPRERDERGPNGSMRCAPRTSACSGPTPSTPPAPARTTRTSCSRARVPTPAPRLCGVDASAGLGDQRDRRLRLLPSQRAAEGQPAGARDAGPDAAPGTARAMLADEAFALHFLQDVYAAGHIAGTWGTASQRQGTHDHYNQNGLEVLRPGRAAVASVVLMGDAHMRPEDASWRPPRSRQLGAGARRRCGTRGGVAFPHTPAAPAAADGFDVCTQCAVSAARARTAPRCRAQAAPRGDAASDAGAGSRARASARCLAFATKSVSSSDLPDSIDGRAIDGSFVDSQTRAACCRNRPLGRAGFGLDGVMGESGDGLVFASLGLRSDGPSTNNSRRPVAPPQRPPRCGHTGALGVTTRLRMPFYLIPGDLLLMSPLFFINRDAYTAWP